MRDAGATGAMSAARRYRAYPAYKPSGVEWLGDIPEGWEASRLKWIVNQSRQITYGIVQAGPNIEGGIPYIRPADMTDEDGIRDFSGLLRTSAQIAAEYTRSELRSGDIVCSIGPSFGKVMIVPQSLDGANLTQGTARIAVNQGASPRFIYWVLRAPMSYHQWESSIGGATFRALNLGPLAETELPLPPVDIQTQIAAFLDYETAKIDALIAKQERLIALLEEKRQAVISHAVTKGLDPTAPLRPSGIDWLGDIPAHWEVGKVKYFARMAGGYAFESGLFKDEGIQLLRIGNLYLNSLSLERQPIFLDESCLKAHPNFCVRRGDILMSLTGTLGKTDYGFAIIVDEDGPFLLNQRVARLDPDHEKIASGYLLYSLRSDPYLFQLYSLPAGTKQANLSNSDVLNIEIAVPPTSEQLEIAEFLRKQVEIFKSLVGNGQSAIGLLKERRTALISAAVTGKIDVRDWQAPAAPSQDIASGTTQDTHP